MAIPGPNGICQELSIPVGSVCSPDPFGGGVEGWEQGFRPDIWATFSLGGATVETAVGTFGGRALITPPVSSSNPVNATIQTIDGWCHDMRGGEAFMRVKPMESPGERQRGYWRIYAGEGENPFVEIYYALDHNEIGFFILDGDSFETDETLSITYDPVAHAWWRAVHDDATGILSLQTAPFCGNNWTTHISGEIVSGGMAHVRHWLYQDVDPGSSMTPGWFGPMYTAPLAVSEPEPES